MKKEFIKIANYIIKLITLTNIYTLFMKHTAHSSRWQCKFSIAKKTVQRALVKPFLISNRFLCICTNVDFRHRENISNIENLNINVPMCIYLDFRHCKKKTNIENLNIISIIHWMMMYSWHILSDILFAYVV